MRKAAKVTGYSAMAMGHPSLRISLAMAEECIRVVDGWKVSPPAPKDSEKLMRRVLKLHVAVGKIERPVP